MLNTHAEKLPSGQNDFSACMVNIILFLFLYLK